MRNILDHTSLTECLLYWRGVIHAKKISEIIGITRKTIMMTVLPRLKDKGVRFENRTGKGELSGLSLVENHAPITCSGTMAEAVALVHLSRSMGYEDEELLGFDVEDLVALRPETAHSQRIARTLGNAAAQKRVVQGVYVSKQGSAGVEFSPHTLVRTAHRVHWRGHAVFDDNTGISGKTGDYVDLVPERFQSCSMIPTGKGEGYVPKDKDHDWNQMVNVCAHLNPGIPPDSRDAILEETDDPEGRLVVPTRKALARYVALWMESRTVLVPGQNREIKVWVVE